MEPLAARTIGFPECPPCLIQRDVVTFQRCMAATNGPRMPIIPGDRATEYADFWIGWPGHVGVICDLVDNDRDGDVDLHDWYLERR